ncbi:General stress protein 26 [Parelusimicrobium proximum]|uniref:pyridoxamine 5'-phosphate oxidase family protein n=1 Tax=Parelusimicrobium proximum TaxID=3228953 RepID=UPI003D17424E
MSEEIIKKAAGIIKGKTGLNTEAGSEPYCVLAVIDENGFPSASTLTAADSEGIKQLTFGTGLSSNKAKRLKNNNRASVCFCAENYNITLVGTVKILTDLETKKANWYPGLSHHFKGPEDEEYCVLQFVTHRYSIFVDWQEIAGIL